MKLHWIVAMPAHSKNDMIKNNRLSKLLFGALAVLCALLAVKNAVAVFGIALLSLYEHTQPFKFALITGGAALFFACVLWAVFRLQKNRARLAAQPVPKTAVYMFILFAAALTAGLAFTFWVSSPAYSDFLTFYKATNLIADGDMSFVNGAYWQNWSYQTGFPAFMSPVAALFPDNLNALLVVNNLFAAGVVPCMFYLLKKVLPAKSAFFLCLGYLLLPYPYMVAAVYTNQLSSAFFIYLGLCLALSKTPLDIRRCAAGALCVSVGHMFRPEGILLLGAMLAVALILLVGRGKSPGSVGPEDFHRWKRIAPPAVFCAVYLCANVLLSQAFALTGLNPNGLGNHFPLYKFAVGLNEEFNGQYNKADADNLFVLEYAGDRPGRDRYAAELIRERLSVGPGRLAGLLLRKLDVQWTDRTENYPALSAFPDEQELGLLGRNVQAGTFRHFVTMLDSLWFVLLFAGCAVTGFLASRAKETSILCLLMAVFLLMAVLAFGIVEAQRRYAYLLMPAIWILAALWAEFQPKADAVQGGIFRRERGLAQGEHGDPHGGEMTGASALSRLLPPKNR